MTKWEYATAPLISHALQEILNQWGEDGWELVNVVRQDPPPDAPAGASPSLVAYFKRPKE